MSTADCHQQPRRGFQKLSGFLAMAIVLCSVCARAVGVGTLDQVSGWYPLGTSLTIHAIPGTNSVFTAWQGNTNGAAVSISQITIPITSSLSVTGLFSAIQSAAKQPILTPKISVSGKSLVLEATNGVPNGGWVLLESTNLLLPLSQWQTNLTGFYDRNGSLSTNLLNSMTHPVGFLILK